MNTTITSKGQVTIPRAVRKHFGLRQGMAVSFAIEGDHIAVRPAPAAGQGEGAALSGFALIRSRRRAVPADFDTAGLVDDAP